MKVNFCISSVRDTVTNIIAKVSGRDPEFVDIDDSMRKMGFIPGKGLLGDVLADVKDELGVKLPAAACFAETVGDFQKAVVAKACVCARDGR